MKKILCSLFIIAIAFAVIGCAGKKKADNYDFKGKVLVPCELAGDQINACYMNPCPVIMFDSAEYRFNGNSGCNQMFGEYTCDESNINFSNVGATRMMCEPAANEVETKMLNVINEANNYKVEDNKVTFYSNDKPLAVFIVKDKKPCGGKVDEHGNKVHCSDKDHAHEGEAVKHCGNHDKKEGASCTKNQETTTSNAPAVEEKTTTNPLTGSDVNVKEVKKDAASEEVKPISKDVKDEAVQPVKQTVQPSLSDKKVETKTANKAVQ